MEYVTTYQAAPVRSCEWMFGDAANGLCGLHSMVGLNPLRWSGTVSIDKAIQQITEVQRHNDRPITLNVLPNDVCARQHEFPTTQQALNYLLSLQEPVAVQTMKYAAPQVISEPVQYVQQEAAPQYTYAAPQVQYIQQEQPQVQYIQQEQQVQYMQQPAMQYQQYAQPVSTMQYATEPVQQFATQQFEPTAPAAATTAVMETAASGVVAPTASTKSSNTKKKSSKKLASKKKAKGCC